MNDWDRMRAGKLYNADSADIAGYHEKGMGLCDKFNRTPIWMKKRKQRILEKMIPSAKDGGAYIFAPFYCEYGVNIHFGKGCFVNYKCTFLDCAPIELGDGVWIGANVTIATPCHPFLSEERLPQEYPDGFHDLEYAKPIRIGDGSWICSSATICDHHTNEWYYSNNNKTTRKYIIQGRIMRWEIHIRTVKYRTTQQS